MLSKVGLVLWEIAKVVFLIVVCGAFGWLIWLYFLEFLFILALILLLLAAEIAIELGFKTCTKYSSPPFCFKDLTDFIFYALRASFVTWIIWTLTPHVVEMNIPHSFFNQDLIKNMIIAWWIIYPIIMVSCAIEIFRIYRFLYKTKH